MLATHDAQKLEIKFEIDIDAPPVKVWAKLATLDGMHEWFANDLVFEHKVGGRFRMQGEMPQESPYRFTGEVVKIVPEQELAFTWTSELGEDGVWPTSTLVTFKLKPTASGTHVTLTHTGFEALGDLAQSAYEGHVMGWQASTVLESLKEAVAGS